jgi:hypothetical protein
VSSSLELTARLWIPFFEEVADVGGRVVCEGGIGFEDVVDRCSYYLHRYNIAVKVDYPRELVSPRKNDVSDVLRALLKTRVRETWSNGDDDFEDPPVSVLG